ncbi:hypothetical protein DAMNIGENAA_17540 [Desulforhabdus amnigena]|uniref:Uncharacterized protein n=1 Tax=Desulforhabdus amnigena TaxID=40218 RepID=A0A9W6CYV0_9BACT|nr:hypothetical protein DAMNIGENAA_17540 [Desulforhabdus amnigena]
MQQRLPLNHSATSVYTRCTDEMDALAKTPERCYFAIPVKTGVTAFCESIELRLLISSVQNIMITF